MKIIKGRKIFFGFGVNSAIVLFFIGMRDPARTLLGVAVVLIGLPVYYLIFRDKGGRTNGLDQNDSAG